MQLKRRRSSFALSPALRQLRQFIRSSRDEVRQHVDLILAVVDPADRKWTTVGQRVNRRAVTAVAVTRPSPARRTSKSARHAARKAIGPSFVAALVADHQVVGRMAIDPTLCRPRQQHRRQLYMQFKKTWSLCLWDICVLMRVRKYLSRAGGSYSVLTTPLRAASWILAQRRM